MNIQIRDGARELTMANHPSNPDKQINVKLAEIILEDAHFQPCWIHRVQATADITQAGLNGLDAGTAAPNTWYYVWIIAKPTGDHGVLLSTSADHPTLPHGYLFQAFVGAIQTDNSNNLHRFEQVGGMVARDAVPVLSEGTADAPTVVDCANAIPKRAVKALGSFDLNPNPQQTTAVCGVGWLASKPQLGRIQFRGFLQTSQFWFSAPFCIPVVESQHLYYQLTTATSNAGNASISISGFEF